MKERLKTYLEIVLVTIVLIFVTAIGVGVAIDLFWAADPKAPEAFRGGFIGAFLAFLFVRIGDTLKRFDDRRRKTRHALVTLEHRYNECAVALSTNRYLIKIWDGIAKAAAEHAEVPNLSRYHPVEIRVPREPLVEITNLDLINELFNLNLDLESMNRDLRNFTEGIGKIMDAFIDDKISRANLDDIILSANKDRLALELHLDRIMKGVERANAAIVWSLGKQTLLEKLFIATTETRYPRNFEKARDEQIEKNRAHVEPMFAQRLKEIEEIDNRAKAKAAALEKAAKESE